MMKILQHHPDPGRACDELLIRAGFVNLGGNTSLLLVGLSPVSLHHRENVGGAHIGRKCGLPAVPSRGFLPLKRDPTYFMMNIAPAIRRLISSSVNLPGYRCLITSATFALEAVHRGSMAFRTSDKRQEAAF